MCRPAAAAAGRGKQLMDCNEKRCRQKQYRMRSLGGWYITNCLSVEEDSIHLYSSKWDGRESLEFIPSDRLWRLSQFHPAHFLLLLGTRRVYTNRRADTLPVGSRAASTSSRRANKYIAIFDGDCIWPVLPVCGQVDTTGGGANNNDDGLLARSIYGQSGEKRK